MRRADSDRDPRWRSAREIQWPEGTEEFHFENIEGIALLYAKAVSNTGVDTTGPFVIDTGAGSLALDTPLARRLGILDADPANPEAVGIADRPLARLLIGAWEQDVVSPVLTFDAGIATRVTDRPVLGLLGQRIYRDRALWLDYAAEQLAFIPEAPGSDSSDATRASQDALAPVLGARATPVAFRLLGDGKVVVRATVGDPARPDASRRLTLIVDTGSSKTVLFEHALAAALPEYRRWPTIEGLSAPTLLGDAGAKMTRVPSIRLDDARGGTGDDGGRGTGDESRRSTGDDARREAGADDGGGAAECRDSDAALLDSGLEHVLATDIGEPVHGLLGYSFLRHYRVVLDYPHRVLWLDPLPHDGEERPYEYTHVGLQLERRVTGITVVAVVVGSPAATAGIRVGDTLVDVDGHAVAGGDLIAVARALEGPAGSIVRLVTRRDGSERRYRLVRRRLL